MTKTQFIDWLFRLRIYRGIKMIPPKGLFECTVLYDGGNVTRYSTELNYDDTNVEVAEWLEYNCDGPWRINLKKPYSSKELYLTFARKIDAAIFRLMTS